MVYVMRFARLAPELTKRAVRKENLLFHAVRGLDKTEAVLTRYLETMPIRHAERFERWWNDTLHAYNDG